MDINKMRMDDILEGDTLYTLCGVEGNTFQLGSLVFDVVEYQGPVIDTQLDEVRLIELNRSKKFPIVNVYFSEIREDEFEGFEFEGFEFVDEDGHSWVVMGSIFEYNSYNDEYSCSFVFEYCPKYHVPENLEILDPMEIHIEKFI